MSPEPLPTFRYYRDPVSDGTIEESPAECSACGRSRGFVITSTAYGIDVPNDAQFCPWCVADGRAHQRYGVTFNEVGVSRPGSTETFLLGIPSLDEIGR